MILDLFIIFLVVSLFFVFLSYYIDNPVLSIIGFVFLFLLGSVILQGNLQYKTGEVENTVYFYDNTSLNQTVLVKNYVYSYFDDSSQNYILGINYSHFFGFWFSIIGVLGLVIVIWNMRIRGDN